MVDREQVIKDFEAYEPYAKNLPAITMISSQYLDVLALLKEQEAEIEKLRRYVNGFSRDAIPVVRCKDCKWNSGTHDIPHCQIDNIPISPDWFCAAGERRCEDG